MRISTLLFFAFFLVAIAAQAQKKDSIRAQLTTRYMHTHNASGLKDFHVVVTHSNLYYGRKFNKWLSFGIQVNGLLNYGTDNIEAADAVTGSGPIYEGNLWNQRLFSGSFDMAFTQLYLNAKFGRHQVTMGQFLKNTPLINIEPWPYPNGIEGLWYEYKGSKKWQAQFGFVNSISPRQSGVYTNIGASIGQAGTGRDIFGNPSQYRGNVNSEFILVANGRYQLNDAWRFDAWNYYADNLFNVLLLEPQWQTPAKDLMVKTLLIYQRKVGEGGNENPFFTYMEDGNLAYAYYFGLRVERRMGDGLLQFNVSRIADQGRLLLPKEWGLEPFYAFQRRTRIEGAADVLGFMVKYQHIWEDERAKLRVYASGGYTRMPTPFDPARNKFGVPSFSHWDVSPKFEFKQGPFTRLSLELYIAVRFLADDIRGNQSFQINRNDFFHTDAILTWRL